MDTETLRPHAAWSDKTKPERVRTVAGLARANWVAAGVLRLGGAVIGRRPGLPRNVIGAGEHSFLHTMPLFQGSRRKRHALRRARLYPSSQGHCIGGKATFPTARAVKQRTPAAHLRMLLPLRRCASGSLAALWKSGGVELLSGLLVRTVVCHSHQMRLLLPPEESALSATQPEPQPICVEALGCQGQRRARQRQT